MANGLELLEGAQSIKKTMHVAQNPARVIPICVISNPKEAFIELYNSHYNQVKKYALTFYETKQDAEDTAQIIFMRLWERKEKLHTIEIIENYLFTMTRNQFLSDRRSFGRKKVVHKHYTSILQSSANFTEQEVLFGETKDIINNGIRCLPSRMQHALTLKINGYKIDKIASHMGIKRTTARNHLQKAVKRIEACF